MKTVGSIFGKADRYKYQLGNTTICIDKLHKPVQGHTFEYVWQIRESRSHTKKRSDKSGDIAFPQVHVSVIKMSKMSQSFQTYGKALVSAIQYLNQKRKEGEI